ncbi:MAG: RHS repeat protein [Clostridia bacterium]|nr:RHS repeat protein [Clostridia bacterium]
MRLVNKIAVFFIVFAILNTNVFAKDTKDVSFKATVENGNAAVEETDIRGSADYSDLEVTVVKKLGEESSVIYTGLLGNFENGIWSNVDFSDINILFVINWETDEAFCIYPAVMPSSDLNGNSQSNPMNAVNHKGNLLSDDSGLGIASQIKINGVSVGEDGVRIIDNANMSCTFSIANSGDTANKVSAILATYTETGRLYNVRAFEADVAADDSKNIEIIYQFDAENEYTGKLMLWNTLSGMIPVRTSIDFSQTSGINAYYYNSDNRLLQIDKANGTSLSFTYDNMGNLLTKTIRK